MSAIDTMTDSDIDALKQRIRSLEAENKRLRGKVRELSDELAVYTEVFGIEAA